jgi:dihydroneopterin aldolase/2-amino-4-hydroxy-6-hydroxymethyldihydropteridine diphosphokinase
MFETLLYPEELLLFLQELEDAAGRKRSKNKNARWEARTLDLDILLYEDIIMAEEQLKLPHPDLHNRDFVLAPLIMLNPHLKHPLLNRTMAELLSGLTDNHIK